MKLGSSRDHSDQLADVVLSHMVLRKSEHFYDSVNVPLTSGSVFFAHLTNLIGQLLFEFSVSNQQVI